MSVYRYLSVSSDPNCCGQGHVNNGSMWIENEKEAADFTKKCLDQIYVERDDYFSYGRLSYIMTGSAGEEVARKAIEALESQGWKLSSIWQSNSKTYPLYSMDYIVKEWKK